MWFVSDLNASNFNILENSLTMRYSNFIRMVGFGQRARSRAPHRGRKLKSYKGNVGKAGRGSLAS